MKMKFCVNCIYHIGIKKQGNITHVCVAQNEGEYDMVTGKKKYSNSQLCHNMRVNCVCGNAAIRYIAKPFWKQPNYSYESITS